MFPLPDCKVLRGRGRVLDGATFREVVSEADYSLYIHPPVHEGLGYSYSGYFSASQRLREGLAEEELLLELANEHHRWQFAILRPMAVVESRILAFGKAVPMEGWVTDETRRTLLEEEEELAEWDGDIDVRT